MAPDANDSAAVISIERERTSVASVNTGSGVVVAGTNRGSRRTGPSIVAPANDGAPTAVAPANTTYHQRETTTSDHRQKTGEERRGREVGHPADVGLATSRAAGGPGERPPHDAAGEAAALRAFASANDRAATPAERKLLRDLAERFEPVAAASRDAGADGPTASGWGWIEAAVWEAVEAGSAFVAPRRLREILARWEREGFPRRGGIGGEKTAGRQRDTSRSGQARSPAPVTQHPSPPTFVIEEVGLSNRQVWAAALAEIAQRGTVSRADLETWLRPAALIGREGQTLIVGAPNAVARDRIAGRLLPVVREGLAAAVGVELPIQVKVEGEVTQG